MKPKPKRSNTAKAKYLPGRTWRDVLKGAPVLRGEARQRKDTTRKRLALRCRDCSHVAAPRRSPSAPRCHLCGGIMDPEA